MDIESGNLDHIDTAATGWFIGYGDWVRKAARGAASLRYLPQESLSHTLCMKWGRHRKGDAAGLDKPASAGRTISILVSEHGCFRVQFSMQGHFPEAGLQEVVLRKQGDFIAWGPGMHHRWFVDEDSLILTLRWIPQGEETAR